MFADLFLEELVARELHFKVIEQDLLLLDVAVGRFRFRVWGDGTIEIAHSIGFDRWSTSRIDALTQKCPTDVEGWVEFFNRLSAMASR